MLCVLSVIQEPCYSAVTASFLCSFLIPHTLATLQGERTICNFPHAVFLLILLSLLVLFLSNLPTCLQVIINGHYNIIIIKALLTETSALLLWCSCTLCPASALTYAPARVPQPAITSHTSWTQETRILSFHLHNHHVTAPDTKKVQNQEAGNG